MFLKPPGLLNDDRVTKEAFNTWQDLGVLKIVELSQRSPHRVIFEVPYAERNFMKGVIRVCGQDIMAYDLQQEPEIKEEVREPSVLEDYVRLVTLNKAESAHKRKGSVVIPPAAISGEKRVTIAAETDSEAPDQLSENSATRDADVSSSKSLAEKQEKLFICRIIRLDGRQAPYAIYEGQVKHNMRRHGYGRTIKITGEWHCGLYDDDLMHG